MTNTREQADMTDTPITHPLSSRLRVPGESDPVVETAADELDRQAAEIARLRAEVEALRVDAERWNSIPQNHLEHLMDVFYSHTFQDCSIGHIRECYAASINAARTPEGRSDG